MNIIPVNLNIPFSSNSFAKKVAAKEFSGEAVLSKQCQNRLNSASLIHPDILRADISKSRASLLKPIQSKEEYDNALEKLYNTTYFACDRTRDFFDDMGYEKVDDELKALPLYCGINDRSYFINSWLSGRKDDLFQSVSDDEIINAIRAFEYSLNKLDEKYGKFEGKVYRCGYFNPNSDKQYYSASDEFRCANSFSHHIDCSHFKPFSIIKVKNGHRIFDFQKDTATPVSLKFEKNEHEVLIDRKSKFRQIPKDELTKDDINEIKMMLRKAISVKPWQLINLEKLDKKYNIYSNFTVWEEI